MKTKILLSTLLIAGGICSASASISAHRLYEAREAYEAEFNTVFIAPVITEKLDEIKVESQKRLAEPDFVGQLIAELKKTFPTIQIQSGEISPYVNLEQMANDFIENVYKQNFELSVRDSLFTEGTETSNAIFKFMNVTLDGTEPGKMLARIRSGKYNRASEVRDEVKSVTDAYIKMYDPYQRLVGAVASFLEIDKGFRDNVIVPKLLAERKAAKLKKKEKELFEVR